MDDSTLLDEDSPTIQIQAVTTLRSSNISQLKVKGDMYCELDSHADTCSFGPDAYLVQDTGQTISVTGFLENLGTVNNVRIVTAAVAYDCPDTSQTYILFFQHQALYFPKLDKHLICPAQLRSNNVIVNDTRKGR